MVLLPRGAQFSLLPVLTWYTPTLSLFLPYNVSVEGPTFFHPWSFLSSRLGWLCAHGADWHVPPSSVFPAHWPLDPEGWTHTNSILLAKWNGDVFLHQEVCNVCFSLFLTLALVCAQCLGLWIHLRQRGWWYSNCITLFSLVGWNNLIKKIFPLIYHFVTQLQGW